MPTVGGFRINAYTGDVVVGGGSSSTTAIPGAANGQTTIIQTVSGIQSVSGRNLGPGVGLFMGSNGAKDVTLDFRSLVAGNNIALSSDGSKVTISSTATSGVNTFVGLTDAADVIIPNGVLIGAVGSADARRIDFTSAPGAANRVLHWDGTAFGWAEYKAGTVTSVGLSGTSDITVAGGPITGSGNISVALSNTGVVAGFYQSANVTVDAKGRIVAISDGVDGGGGTPGVASITLTPSSSLSVTGASAATGNVSATIDLANTGVTAGVYASPSSVTVDAKGRITSITAGSGAGAGSITGVSLASSDNSITVTGGPFVTGSAAFNVALPSVGVSGVYNGPTSITVDSKGRVTAIATGAVGTITGITLASTDLTVTGGTGGAFTSGAASYTLNLSTTGVTAGTYRYPSVTVDNKGRVTGVVNGTAVTQITSTDGSVTVTTSGADANGRITYNLSTTSGNTVSPGSYTGAITVDSAGRITSISEDITAGTGVVLGATGTGGNATFVVEGANAAILSVGSSAERPSSPSAGMLRYNTTIASFEFHNGTAWGAIGAGGGGGGGDGTISVSNASGVVNADTDSLIFTGRGVTVSAAAGATTVNIADGSTAYALMKYTTAQDFVGWSTPNDSNYVVTKTSDVSVVPSNAAAGVVTFTFTGRANPPTSIMVLAQKFDTNEFFVVPVNPAFSQKVIPGGGTNTSPTLFGAFTTLTLDLNFGTMGADSDGTTQRAHVAVLFKF